MRDEQRRWLLRGLAILAATTSLVACAPERPNTVMVMVRVLSPDDIRLGDARVPLNQLDEAILTAALAEGQGMDAATVRQTAIISVAVINAPPALVQDVAEALRGFDRVVYVTEDRRS